MSKPSRSKAKTAARNPPMPPPKALDVDEESQRLLNEIEEQYPPQRCSLATYREVLRSLVMDLRNRIGQLNDEIGSDD